MKFSGLAVLALSVLFAGSSYADPVHLGVTGTPSATGNGLAETSLAGSATLSFTLAQDTDILSHYFGIYLGTFQHPGDGAFTITLTGPGNMVDWYVLQSANPSYQSVSNPFPTFLAAGDYAVEYQALPCPGCINGYAGMDYYFQPSFSQVGGTVNEDPATFDGHLGWDLTGNTVTSDVSAVPEPGTAALVGSGMLAAFAGIRRRSLNA